MHSPVVILPGPRPQADTPEALLAVLPCLLGARPAGMTVITGFAPGDPRHAAGVAAYRFGAPRKFDEDVADHVQHALTVLPRHGLARFTVAFYLPERDAARAEKITAYYAGMTGFEVTQLAADGDVYWDPARSDTVFLCDDGHPAASLYQGLRDPLPFPPGCQDLRPSRADALRGKVQAFLSGPAAEDLRGPDGPDIALGLATAEAAASAWQADGRIPAGDIARLLTLLRGLEDILREQLAAAPAADAEQNLDMWEFIAGCAPAGAAAAPATLLAVAALKHGSPLLAAAALSLALADDKHYLPAQVLRDQLAYGVPVTVPVLAGQR